MVREINVSPMKMKQMPYLVKAACKRDALIFWKMV